jgi:hypothetical protein
MLCIACASAFPSGVFADSVTDTLSVYVGYYGGPYYEKSTYHWTELDDLYGGALDSYEVAYSYTSGSRTVIDSARGFYLADFLQFAGVDLNSIATLDFYTKDHTSGAYRSFTKYAMLDAPRYYFPNLGVDPETETLAPRAGGSLWDGAEQVETMMALEDNWEWDAEGTNFSNPGTSSRFRLLFGQLDPNEAMTSASAKYVYAIYVTFSGMPILTAEEPDMPIKVGSDYRVTVNIAAEDSLLDAYVRDNLVWSSNNTDVIEVDLYGKLRVKKRGEAVISVGFGDSAASVKISVEDESGGAGEASGANAQERSDSAGATPADGAEAVSYSENAEGVYILSSRLMARTEFAEWVNSVLDHDVSTDSDAGGIANRREGEMSDGAEALRVKIRAYSVWPAIAVLYALYALGSVGEFVSFRLRA